MAKRSKTPTRTETLAAVRGIERARRIDAGIREPRAVRYPDRRKTANRTACRGRHTPDS